MMKATILNLIEQLSDSARLQGASLDEMKRIAEEHQSAHALDNGQT